MIRSYGRMVQSLGASGRSGYCSVWFGVGGGFVDEGVTARTHRRELARSIYGTYTTRSSSKQRQKGSRHATFFPR